MSNTYGALKEMFNNHPKDVIRVVGRERSINGCMLVRTITRGALSDVQFKVPHTILANTDYFVPIHDDLFPVGQS